MNPRILAALLIVLITALGLYFSYPLWSSWFAISDTATSTPTGTRPSVTPLSIEEHGTYYDITGTYPPRTPLPGSADQAAVATLKAFIVNASAEFKNDANLDALTPEDIKMQGLDQGRKYALDMTYRVHSSPTTISYAYTIYADTLGAHPNGYFRTFTFDSKSGAELELADVFDSNTEYLETLSVLSRAKLRTQLATLEGVREEEVDSGMLDSGTTADPLNFANFYFDGNDFVLLFPPYQVAPYVAGPQTLSIPKTELVAELRPAYH